MKKDKLGPFDGKRYMGTEKQVKENAIAFLKESQSFMFVGLHKEDGKLNIKVSSTGTGAEYEYMIGKLFSHFQQPYAGVLDGN